MSQVAVVGELMHRECFRECFVANCSSVRRRRARRRNKSRIMSLAKAHLLDIFHQQRPLAGKRKKRPKLPKLDLSPSTMARIFPFEDPVAR